MFTNKYLPPNHFFKYKGGCFLKRGWGIYCTLKFIIVPFFLVKEMDSRQPDGFSNAFVRIRGGVPWVQGGAWSFRPSFLSCNEWMLQRRDPEKKEVPPSFSMKISDTKKTQKLVVLDCSWVGVCMLPYFDGNSFEPFPANPYMIILHPHESIVWCFFKSGQTSQFSPVKLKFS